tara:strand:+ start:9049 stop:10029 length:981 start_codon:yes stop_codon:yes gene_type:complete
MRVLVTGATGFVGLNVVEALLMRGEEVVAFDSAPLPPGAEAALASHGGKFDIVQGDVTNESSVTQAVSGCDTLIHAAAITAGLEREQRDAHLIVDVNVKGTINALNAAREAGVGRIVHFSSSGVYGESSFEHDVLHENVAMPLPDSLYTITKYAGERVALRHRTLYDLDLVCLRPGYVFGPWERNTGVRDTLSPVLQVAVAAARGEEVVLPRPCLRDWVYSRDIADSAMALLDASDPKSVVYNSGGPELWSLEAWCALTAAKMPEFSYRIGDDATIDLNNPRDRGILDMSRLQAEADFVPQYGLDKSFEDYMAWISGQPDFAQTPL